MFKKLLLTTALCLLPSAAFAEWVPVSQSSQGDVASVDKSTIATQGNFRVFWVNVDHGQGSIAISRTLMAADCASNNFSYLYLIQGDRQGRVIVNNSVNTPIQQAPTGSINSKLINAACTGFIDDPQLAALTRARQINADAITKAMETAAQMFR